MEARFNQSKYEARGCQVRKKDYSYTANAELTVEFPHPPQRSRFELYLLVHRYSSENAHIVEVIEIDFGMGFYPQVQAG